MSRSQKNAPPLNTEEIKEETIVLPETVEIQSEQNSEDEFFTRQELHEYFAARYPAEQIDKALFIFAENGAELDPTGDRFSLSITEELEEVLKIASKAIEDQKQLGEVQPDETLTVLESQEAIASQFSVHSNPDLIAAMVKLVAQEGVELGSLLTQIKSSALGKTLKQGNLEIVKSLFDGTQQTTSCVRELVASDEQINKMLKGYGVEVVNVNEFLDEVRQTTIGVKNSVKAIAPAREQNFDMEAFLLEAGD